MEPGQSTPREEGAGQQGVRPLGQKWETGRNLKEDRLRFISSLGFWAFVV